MLIDFHTHTFPPAIAGRALEKLQNASRTVAFTDGTDQGLLASMDRSGITQSVLLPVATNPDKVGSMNASFALMKDPRLIRFGCAHPLDPLWEQHLEEVKAAGLPGIKLHPVYQGVDFDDPLTLRLLKKAAELDLIVVTHAGLDIGYPGVSHVSPQMIIRAYEHISVPKLVLAHLGGWRQWEEASALLPPTGVYVDTSFAIGALTPLPGSDASALKPMLSPKDAADVIRAFGADRVLFGTDSPWSDQAAYTALVRSLPLSEKEKSLIFSENARRLLGDHIFPEPR